MMRRMVWAFCIAFVASCFIQVLAQEQFVIFTNVEVVTVGEEVSVITWVTNLETPSVLNYGVNEEMANTVSSDVETKYHYIELFDLEPSTTYYFQVSDGTSTGGSGSFETLQTPTRTPSARVVVLADVHFDLDGINNPGGAMYGDSVELMDSFMSELSLMSGVDAVILLGDNVQGAEEDYSEFYSLIKSSKIPFYPVMGNWDKSEVGWENYHDSYIGLESTYYSFDLGGLHIVVLDSAVQGSVGGALDDDQISWLANDIESSSDSRVLIFMHHMFIVDEIMGLDMDSYGALETAILEHGDVITVFSGHNHKNSYDVSSSQTPSTTVASLVQYPVGYTTLDLSETGYSQSFWKVSTTLEISENSRIRIKASSVDPEADQDFLGEIEERNHVYEPAEPVENEAPIIRSVTIEDEVIEPGEQTTISVDAIDPDEDPLEYIYGTGGGDIVGDGPTATYTAPDREGTYGIEVKVFDGHVFSSPFDVLVTVKGEIPAGDDNLAPEIERVIYTPSRVEEGGIVELKTIASDPDGDPLQYSYYTSYGEIIGEGKEVTWKAPFKTGHHGITVIVSDGELQSEGYLVEIEVYKEEGTSSDDSPFLSVFSILFLSCLIGGVQIFRGYRKRK